MVKLLIKYMIGFIILGLVAISSLYLIASQMWQSSLEQTIKTANLGVFQMLEAKLLKYPQAKWPAIVQQLHPTEGGGASVLPLTEINLPKDKMQQLLRGKFVINMGETVYYFGYGISETLTYQRIGKSDYALKMDGIPAQWLAQHVSAWMMHLIVLELQQTPRAIWPKKIQQLSSIYHLPLALIAFSDQSVQAIKKSLANNVLILGNPNPGGNIEYVYIKVDDMVLKIGPIPYPVYPQYRVYLLIGIFIFLAIAFILILTIIFSKNLDKIYRITQTYSHGDFSPPPRFSKHSTLRTLYDNIFQMGDKIQQLIDTQRNLTRFVAHECRTPVSTMLFAVNNLEKENLSETARNQVVSIKEDISDLNHLISDFLNYARFSDKELKVTPQLVGVNQWVQSCVDKYKEAPHKITFHSSVPATYKIVFDPALMRHVISNLLDNAMKHAHSQVQISMRLQPERLSIDVEDDGTKIAESDKENVFVPFVRLDNQKRADKGGFGLGLHIAQMITKHHQGEIAVFDSSLRGARFSVFLPIKTGT